MIRKPHLAAQTKHTGALSALKWALPALAMGLMIFAPDASAHRKKHRQQTRCETARDALQMARNEGLPLRPFKKLKRRMCGQAQNGYGRDHRDGNRTNHVDRVAYERQADCRSLDLVRDMARHRDGFRDDFRALSRRTCNGSLVTGTQYYRNGNLAVTSGGTWYYKNGRLAKTSSGTMYYPNGNLAVTSSGTVYYPNGNIAYNGRDRASAVRDAMAMGYHVGRDAHDDDDRDRRRRRNRG